MNASPGTAAHLMPRTGGAKRRRLDRPPLYRAQRGRYGAASGLERGEQPAQETHRAGPRDAGREQRWRHLHLEYERGYAVAEADRVAPERGTRGGRADHGAQQREPERLDENRRDDTARAEADRTQRRDLDRSRADGRVHRVQRRE